jgi:hypothetical protein
MIHHSELVSQWQERLASAEDLARSTARFRWIHLARVRLYRFLLACYGRGQWRTGATEAEQLPAEGVVSQYEASEWSGKPPKTVGAIQSVLKSVHNAQDRAPPVGPLVDGLDPDTFLAVTSSDARIDVEKCERFLIDRGFHPRVVGRGRRMTVEVPYAELKAAEALVDAHRQMLRPVLKTRADKLRQHPVLPEETQMLVVGVMLIAPVVGLAALSMGAALLKDQLSVGAMIALFFGGIHRGRGSQPAVVFFVRAGGRSCRWATPQDRTGHILGRHRHSGGVDVAAWVVETSPIRHFDRLPFLTTRLSRP